MLNELRARSSRAPPEMPRRSRYPILCPSLAYGLRDTAITVTASGRIFASFRQNRMASAGNPAQCLMRRIRSSSVAAISSVPR